ncbi:hyalin-like [Diadema setosum]|uniref:hyalin-like n=1 Tax=Diadema setosum TaxID=31175 RepID=UPI003B3AE435
MNLHFSGNIAIPQRLVLIGHPPKCIGSQSDESGLVGQLSDSEAIETCYGTDCSSGFFTSPNHPANYFPYDSRLYLLFVPEATGFSFEFSGEFWVETDEDYLYVGPGLSYGDISNIDSGSQPDDDIFYLVGTEIPASFTLSGTDSAWMYFATDKNIEGAGFNITWSAIEHTTGPVVTCPPNIVSTVKLGVTSTAVTWSLPTATDVSGVTVFQSSTHSPGSTFNVGVTDVTYVYADGSGNTGSCTFTVTVQTEDTTGPVVTCPPNIVSTVELGVTSTAVTWNLPTATDVSGVAVFQSSTHSPGSAFNVGVTDVTYVYADGSGNTGSCTFTVTVQTQDTIGPVVTCPPNIVSTVELGVASTAVTWTLPTATDVSGVAVIQSSTHNPGSTFNVGVTDVTYVYADGSGNTGSCTFTVTVQTQDTIGPVVTCPPNIVSTVELGVTSTAVTWSLPTATDVSGVAVIQSSTHTPGSTFNVGVTDVTYVYADGSGNTGSCTFTVTVQTRAEVRDTLPPTLAARQTSL